MCWDPPPGDQVFDTKEADKAVDNAVSRIEATMTVKAARKTIADAFAADPHFRDVYVANVAMLLHDRYGITNHKTRTKAGYEIIRLVFES